MKHKALVVVAATAISLMTQVHTASAGLIGMPINLRAAIAMVEASNVSRSCERHADDFLAAPALIAI